MRRAIDKSVFGTLYLKAEHISLFFKICSWVSIDRSFTDLSNKINYTQCAPFVDFVFAL